MTTRYDEDTGTVFVLENPCEMCGRPMDVDRVGVCLRCVKQEERAIYEQHACICWATDFGGRSVCGVPCPVHRRA